MLNTTQGEKVEHGLLYMLLNTLYLFLYDSLLHTAFEDIGRLTVHQGVEVANTARIAPGKRQGQFLAQPEVRARAVKHEQIRVNFPAVDVALEEALEAGGEEHPFYRSLMTAYHTGSRLL